MGHFPGGFPGGEMGISVPVQEQTMQAFTATVVELGEQNEGTFGPTPEVEEQFDNFVHKVGRPEYRRKPTGNWRCVDGREDEDGAIEDAEFADGQVPGSLPITNTAGDLMDPEKTGLRLSQLVAKNTAEAIEDGHEVTVHGDDHAEEEGCAANAKMRVTMAKIAANADIVAPLAWAECQLTGLDQHVAEEDVMDAIIAGGERARDDKVWDATAIQVIEIAVAHGAKYQRLKDSHLEAGVAVTLDAGTTYDTQAFARDHQNEDGTRIELFGLSAGEYVATTIRDTLVRGGSQREGALKAMRGLIYATGLCKKIGSKNLRLIALKTD